jgi:hypothetical protein
MSALDLPRYTQALAKTNCNRFPWLVPGEHSRQVRAAMKVAVPDYTGGPATAALLDPYQVPDGMIFSLRGICFLGFVQSWNPASGDLTWTLDVTSGGTRSVDYFVNVDTELGSLERPFPIGGRLEFESLDILQGFVTANANVGIGAPNFVELILWGHLYPASERRAGD